MKTKVPMVGEKWAHKYEVYIASIKKRNFYLDGAFAHYRVQMDRNGFCFWFNLDMHDLLANYDPVSLKNG